MSLLNLERVSVSFGALDIFTGVTVRLAPRAKVGLIGANGAGKTSLLRIIAGLDAPTSGSIHLARGLRIGYLHQEAMQAFTQQSGTLIDEMLAIFAPVRVMETDLRDLEQRMSPDSPDYDPEALDRYGELLEQYELAGGYDYEVRIDQVLHGLGFTGDHYQLPLMVLSGGQKTRALLARLLLEQPDLLILDEPTNHLDIEAVTWLETTLRQWSGTLLIVSHDRYFLDTVVDTIWELRKMGIEDYRGNYSAYLRQREERQAYALQVFQQETDRMAKELDYIKRHIARSSTTDIAYGKLRRLSRDLWAIDQIGIMAYMQTRSWLHTGLSSPRTYTVQEAEQALHALQAPVTRQPSLNLRLNHADTHQGDEVVLKTRHLYVGYPDAPLFLAEEIMLRRGHCAALIGGNGAGKTTLLRTILGQLPPLEGKIQIGNGVKLGYFAQAHNDLNPENTLLDELLRHRAMRPGEARSWLAQYLFRGDDVFKSVAALSGGERARLALAILALQGANFLLLDEPTNHLDIPAQEALQTMLEHFAGTILLVTHDRYLVERLATQVWTLEDGVLEVFHGAYRDFLQAERIAG